MHPLAQKYINAKKLEYSKKIKQERKDFLLSEGLFEKNMHQMVSMILRNIPNTNGTKQLKKVNILSLCQLKSQTKSTNK